MHVILSLLYSSRQQEEYEEVSPQTNSHELPGKPETEAAPNSHEKLSIQLQKNAAY